MNLFPAKNEHQMPVEVKRRLTVAIVFSVLLHAFILSLQFGVPGLGQPGADAPKLERGATSTTGPRITVQISDMLPDPISRIKPVADASPIAASVPSATKSEPTLASHGIQLIAPRAFEPVTPPTEKKELNMKTNKQIDKHLVRLKRKSASTAKSTRPRKVIVSELPDLITQAVKLDDSFVVAVRDPDEVKKEDVAQQLISNMPEPVIDVPLEAKMEVPVEPDPKISLPIADTDAAAASVARFEIDHRKHQQREVENLQHTQDLLATKIQDNSAKEKILQQLNDDNRRQTEQIQVQQAAVLKQQLETEQQAQAQLQAQEQSLKNQHEAATTATLALTEKQRAETIRQVDETLKQQLQAELNQRELQRRERLHEVAKARQQKEELEERALQEAEMQRQLQARQLAQQQAAQATLAAQATKSAQDAQLSSLNGKNQSDVSGRSNRASERANGDDIFGSSNSHAGTDTGTDKKSGAFVLPKSLLSSDLANRSRESAQGLGLLQGKPPLPVLDQKARRHTILNNIEKDVQLRMYADNWKQKIERNGNLNYSQSSSNKSRGDPLVSVSIRSDGSVEQVTILRSSGRDDIDRAVRNIVSINARYAAFPPSIAAQYDVLEIRRIWSFDDNLRIIEELR
ncbi:TonB family protein [Undibacterium sp. SXout11W]|uniref:TonB family protein n=1 Tax=Undibacterium sp. SXout11W TaxID=3413050 RepID=UPI003BF2BA42